MIKKRVTGIEPVDSDNARAYRPHNSSYAALSVIDNGSVYKKRHIF